jgi:general secretion pathway protein G
MTKSVRVGVRLLEKKRCSSDALSTSIANTTERDSPVCQSHRLNEGNRFFQRGFTLIELMLVVAIIGILGTIAMSSYTRFVEKARTAQVVVDMGGIVKQIYSYKAQKGYFPASLAEVGVSLKDPWGNPYVYTRIDSSGDPTSASSGKGKGKGGGGVGGLRKDKNLVPINSDFDLYSKGKDGRSVGPLTAQQSQDDIVRANNGGFIGLAEDY